MNEPKVEIEIIQRPLSGSHPDAIRAGRSRITLRPADTWTTDELRQIFSVAEDRDRFQPEPVFFSPNREKGGFYFKGDEEITPWDAFPQGDGGGVK